MRDAAAGVLVVDDNPAKRTALVAAIAPLGLEVVECDSGRAALRALLGREFAVVLLDINMPDMDGYEVAEHLRTRPKNAHTPILYVTAERETEIDRLRGYATGAVDFILAPVVPEVLRSKILVFVDLYRMRREALEMTERLQASRAALEGRTAELVEANRELESFSYSVSHDLRAPLRAIDGFGQRLLEACRDKLDASAVHYLERIRASTQIMAQLIDDLLNLSRVSRTRLNIQPVNLGALAQRIADEMQRGEPQRSVEFSIVNDANVQGDERLLDIALRNLLGNAWKFTSKRDHARVEFGVTQQDGETVFFVRDNGAGFDMAYADKLFTPFQRLHSAAEFPGTGIGLATVRRIMHRHGGRIWAEAAIDQGAAFYFTFGKGAEHGSKADTAG